jgi:hypothetical protein
MTILVYKFATDKQANRALVCIYIAVMNTMNCRHQERRNKNMQVLCGCQARGACLGIASDVLYCSDHLVVAHFLLY